MAEACSRTRMALAESVSAWSRCRRFWLISPPFSSAINMILSGLSSASVLTPAGFLNYAQSLNFSGECLGGHLGGYQAANLGDGAGLHNQTGIYRYDFGDPVIGTCTESIDGGNHFRFAGFCLDRTCASVLTIYPIVAGFGCKTGHPPILVHTSLRHLSR